MIGRKQLVTQTSWLAKLLILALLILAIKPAAALAQTEDDDLVDEQELVDDVNVDDDMDDDDDDDSLFCASDEYVHPIVEAIATSYELDPATVAGWFCDDGLGLGQIGLALHTAAIIDAQEQDVDDDEADVDEGEEGVVGEEDELSTVQELLNMRLDGYGWGQIWQEYGFVGRPRGESMGLALGHRNREAVDDEEEVADDEDVDEIDDEDVDEVDDEDVDEEEVDSTRTTGRPDHAGRPDNPGASNSNGNGRPDNPGASNSNGGGRPDNPGASNANKDKDKGK